MTAVTAALVALVALLVGSAPTASAGDAGAGRVTAWVACDGGDLLLTVQPVEHLISCADANSGLLKMTWSTWGAAQARGTGVYYWNDCEPNCAAGTTYRAKASITLDRVRVQAGEPVFTRTTIRYVDDTGQAQVERVRSIRWAG
jgi:hypothetical protein